MAVFPVISGEYLLLCLLSEEVVGNGRGRGVDVINAIVK